MVCTHRASLLRKSTRSSRRVLVLVRLRGPARVPCPGLNSNRKAPPRAPADAATLPSKVLPAKAHAAHAAPSGDPLRLVPAPGISSCPDSDWFSPRALALTARNSD
eukprot:4606046-Pyramimonas_sp.AAC.2